MSTSAGTPIWHPGDEIDGLGLSLWLGWWWADPVAALSIVPCVA